MVCTDLSITPPHQEHTPSPSPGADSTSPAGIHTGMDTNAAIELHGLVTKADPSAPFSPIEVKIGAEAGQQKVRAWGPGLEGGVVGKSADFVVEAVGDNVGTLGK